MLQRDKVLETIKQLPNTFSVDEVMDRIFLLEKIDIGLNQSRNNEIITDEARDSKLPEWLS